MPSDPLRLHEVLSQHVRARRRQAQRPPTAPKIPAKRTSPPSKLKLLAKAEKGIARKVALRAAGKFIAPLEIGLTGYAVGRAIKEGYKAYQAGKALSKMKKASEAKYGSVAKAIATRRRRR